MLLHLHDTYHSSQMIWHCIFENITHCSQRVIYMGKSFFHKEKERIHLLSINLITMYQPSTSFHLNLILMSNIVNIYRIYVASTQYTQETATTE